MTRHLLLLYVFLLPFENLWRVLFGVEVVWKPYRLVGLLLVGAFVLRTLMRGQRLRIDFYDKVLMFLVTWGVTAAFLWHSVANEGRLAYTISDISVILISMSVFFVARREIDSLQTVEKLLTALVLGTLASMLLPSSGSDRYAALFSNPNSLALAASAGIIALVCRFLYRGRKNWLSLGVSLGAFLALSGALLSTGSRGALLSLAVALLAVLAVSYRRVSSNRELISRYVQVAGVVVGIILTVSFMAESQNEHVRYRYEQDSWATGSGRFDTWRGALSVAKDHYFLGVGTGQYRSRHQEAMQKLSSLYSPSVAKRELGTHSEYLSILAEYGIICMFLYLAMLFSMGRRLWARLREPTTSYAIPMLFGLWLLNVIAQAGANFILSPQYHLTLGLIAAAVTPAQQPRKPLRDRW